MTQTNMIPAAGAVPFDPGTLQLPDADEFLAGALTSVFNVIPAVGASAIRVLKASLTTQITEQVKTFLQESGGGPIGWQGTAHPDGGGFNIDWGPEGWTLAVNTALFLSITAATINPEVRFTVTEWYRIP